MIFPAPYSYGKGVRDTYPEQRTADTFAALHDALFAQPLPDFSAPTAPEDRKRWKSETPLPWIAQPMGGDGRRSGGNAQPWPLLVLDVDGIHPPEGKTAMGLLRELLQALRETAPCFGWTTSSHTPDAPRARIVIHLDRGVSAPEAKALAQALGDDLAHRLGVPVGAKAQGAGIVLDPSMQDAGHIAFAPLRGCTRIALHETCPPMEASAWLARAPTPVRPALPATTAPTASERPYSSEGVAAVRAALSRIDARNPGAVNDRPTWIRVLASLKSFGWPDAAMEPIAREWSQRSPKFDAQRWPLDWASLKADGGITPATLYKMAGGNSIPPAVSAFTGIPTTEAVPDDCPPLDTDDGLACRFASWLDGTAMHAKGQWHVFTGTYWKPDTAAIEAKLKDFAKEQRDGLADAHAAAVKTGVEQATKEAARQLRAATLLLNQRKQTDVLAAAAVMLRRDGGKLDTHRDLLCVPNGVVDLRTGELRPSDPALLLTMCAGVKYDCAATSPRWEQFIREVLPNPDEAAYLQRWAGYILTGHTREEAMGVWYGQGANGKSVLGDLLALLLGDYAVAASPAILVGKSPDLGGASPELARLAGRRLCYVNESKAGDRLNDATVKQLVSTEKMTARPLYGSTFEFYPTAKIVLRTNNKPIVKDDSDGIWRRMHLLNFAQRFDRGRRDVHLADTLKAELPGILAWCIRGARAWYARGLNPPPTVQAATEAYRSDNDDLGQWFTERVEEGGFTPATVLIADFVAFTGQRNPPSPRRFAEMMRTRRIEPDRTKSARGYAVTLRPQPATAPPRFPAAQQPAQMGHAPCTLPFQGITAPSTAGAPGGFV